MKLPTKKVILVLTGLLSALLAGATGNVQVHNACIPVMMERARNVVIEICIKGPGVLDEIEVMPGGELPRAAIRQVELVATGGMSPLLLRSTSWAMRDQFKRLGGSQTLYADEAYAERVSCVKPPKAGSVTLPAGRTLVPGRNYFYVSVALDARRVSDLTQPFSLEVTRIAADGREVAFVADPAVDHRVGVGVRQHGDDGVYAYRIPGLATTNRGTLLGVYDVRYHTSLDLQDDIDVGLSRSTDGGRTWEPMRIIVDMRRWGGLPEAQNGVGDPAILVDEATGEIFVVALWVHGTGNNRAWTEVGQGLTPEQTGQLVLVSSRDDGRTWSTPRNITPQVKDPSWFLTLQGPGRGITMQDGTLVFAMQHIDSLRMPHAGILYSRDHGATWQTHATPRSNTTEAQVAEVEPGVLMLNMRDNRKTGRAVYTTRDMGRTWSEHPSSGGLREPVCMASLLQVPAQRNVLGRDVLLFSNPDTTKGRNRIAIKASLDGGATWLPENQLLLDEEEGWGYSCLTMVDPATVGILYEGSTGQMVYQSVRLRDVVRKTDDRIVWESLPHLTADGAGLSALYAGVVGGLPIVAGGANFPGVPAAEGGAKCFHDGVYRLDTLSHSWQRAGTLPEAVAYGVSYAVGDALILAGGSNRSGALSTCYRLSRAGDSVAVKPFAALPFAVEQAAGAVVDGVLYLAGGLSDAEPMDRLLRCDTRAANPVWEVVGELPEVFVQPVMVAAADKLYIWGGFNPRSGAVADRGYRYDLATGVWEPVAGVPDGGTLVGATAVSLGDGRILVAGGVNRKIFAKALSLTPDKQREYLSRPAAAYAFRDGIYCFDAGAGTWSCVAVSGRAARAGAVMLVDGSDVLLLGGEIKPGVRTSEMWRMRITD